MGNNVSGKYCLYGPSAEHQFAQFRDFKRQNEPLPHRTASQINTANLKEASFRFAPSSQKCTKN
jgi:hypothetical protein